MIKEEREEGIIKYWNDEKGYGFIEVGIFPDVQDFFSMCLLAHFNQKLVIVSNSKK